MITQLDIDSDLTALRTPACRADLRSIADAWPRTVVGLLPAEEGSSGVVTVRQKLVSRVNNNDVTSSLVKLRGHIPGALISGERKPVLSFGLGLNFAQLSSALFDLKKQFVTADFSCQWLVKAQKKVKKNVNLGKTAMLAFVGGIRGVTLSVFGKEMINGKKRPDVLLTISTKKPKHLFRMLKTARPKMFGHINLPSDGSAVRLLPKRSGMPPIKVAIVGKHLVAFMGSQAAKAAKHLANDELTANGLVYYRLDYDDGLPILISVLNRIERLRSSDSDSLTKLELKFRKMSQWNRSLQYLLNFTDAGVVLKSRATFGEQQAE